jgi:hypothetical protein
MKIVIQLIMEPDVNVNRTPPRSITIYGGDLKIELIDSL